ncbi:tetratricopeptide repeat protein [Limobrevibacterium gyesilva]|uniref:Tetratricopeptide repeat protein n=1 Tax=Limobrevibacterium gyesilva TaxID=2991712 RepID=A0AA42CIF0_9PROT|nr:tetratricopeptide repeat protein [Limobrevibacterium gyesilva]MCW3475820.1 tetratricopeptide repeat protein [Limobrevibacterium gyesilva]
MTHLGPQRAAAGRTDRFGMAHAGGSRPALKAFADAVRGLAAYRPEAPAALIQAIEAAPGLTAAHALRGMTEVLRSLPVAVDAARLAREAACATLSEASTADETALCEALDAALEGRLLAAADVLDAQLVRRPGVLLFVKLATMLRFVAGDGAGMRQTTARVLPAWSPVQPGYGFVLGCHAFGLEETGAYVAAERAGRRAVEHEPQDAWGIHAVAHVYEMTAQPLAGIAWLERCRPAWSGCNNFAFHLAWHLALFHLEQGRHDRVLELYDREVRPTESEEYRDVANAASLLWRLRQEGVDVGNRWAELAGIARRRRHETVLIFATLHRLLALVAVGDRAAAAETLAAIAAAGRGGGDQAHVAATVGLPLARAVAGRDEDAGPLPRIAWALDALGGSAAQRDVFMRTLAALAVARRDPAASSEILALRRRLRRDDRFLAVLGAGDE